MRVKILKVITIVAAMVLFLSIMALDTEENRVALISFMLSAAWLWLVALANSVDIKKGSASDGNTGRANS
ncbi:MAG: hypothetical protein NC225_12710 [Clostridium sp.]|nr:hypothetical protein [Clostridium sp.]MCM1459701.1 hypothetical protein [Bacteroides sp.]